ncbi:MAG: hypothetical protein H6Q69_5054 [Firmicutes bacterium]|nr:hypothetical protein [Bacillota bacterium]
MKCAKCTHRKCYLEGQNCTKIGLADVKEAYVDEHLDIMKAAACTEGRFYNNLTRLEETVEFCSVKPCAILLCKLKYLRIKGLIFVLPSVCV